MTRQPFAHQDALTADEIDQVAQAARFTSVEAVRAHLRRVIERINQQGDRVIKSMDAGKSIDDYTQIIQAINDLTGEALTTAAQLDVLASIARTVKEKTTCHSSATRPSPSVSPSSGGAPG